MKKMKINKEAANISINMSIRHRLIVLLMGIATDTITRLIQEINRKSDDNENSEDDELVYLYVSLYEA